MSSPCLDAWMRRSPVRLLVVRAAVCTAVVLIGATASSQPVNDTVPSVAATPASAPRAPAVADTAASTPAAESTLADHTLRVCLEPDNMPLSRSSWPDETRSPDERHRPAPVDGFEWQLARLMADELHASLEVHWLPLRRGLVRKTLGEGGCDALMGVPMGMERVLTTRPYYRSTYVFVTRARDPRPLRSFDDPRLPDLRIGVQLVGNDLAATPPGHALTRHGAVDHVRGYTVYGDGPAAQRMIDALARGELDAVLVWGPQAGYFVHRSPVPLQWAAARAPADLVDMPFEYGIAMAVRKNDAALRDRLQQALDARRNEVDAILSSYAVPRTDHRGSGS